MSLRRQIALLSLVIGSWSCDATGPEGPVLELTRAKTIWNANAIANYEYVVANNCFCGMGGVPVRIVVQNGAIQSVTVVSTGQPVPPLIAASYHSIDGLFRVIDDAIRRDAAQIMASYSPTVGFPSAVFIDYSKNVADEEFGFEISSFTRR
jgi:hypothetical protein